MLDAAEENGGLKLKLKGVLLGNEEIARAMDDRSAGWSDIIPVQFTKNGLSEKRRAAFRRRNGGYPEDGGGRGRRHDRADPFRRMRRKALCRKGRLACDFCGYSSVCRFEPRRRR